MAVLYFWINNEVPAHQKLNRTFPRIFLTPFWMEVISTGAFIIFYYVYSSVTTMRCQISGNENHSSMRKNNAGAELWDKKRIVRPAPFFTSSKTNLSFSSWLRLRQMIHTFWRKNLVKWCHLLHFICSRQKIMGESRIKTCYTNRIGHYYSKSDFSAKLERLFRKCSPRQKKWSAFFKS